MKRIIIAIIFFLIIGSISPITSSKASVSSYPDVIQGSWYEEHVNKLSALGLIKGYADGTFGVNDPITRENAARIIGRYYLTEGYYIPEDALQVKRFYDLPLTEDQELLELTALLAEERIILGAYGQYNRYDHLTRGQMALLLVRVIQNVMAKDVIAEYKQQQFITTISDIHSVSVEMKEAITALDYIQLTNNTQFYPNSAISRAEFATFISRLLIYKEQLQASLSTANTSETVENQDETLIDKTNSVENISEEVDENVEINEDSAVEEMNTLQQNTEPIQQELDAVQQQTESIQQLETNNEQGQEITTAQSSAIEGPFFTIKQGTTLFSSQNLTKKSGTMIQSKTFPTVQLANADALYFEVGLERFYVNKNDVQFTSEGTTGTFENHLGFLRIQGPYTVFKDSSLTQPIFYGDYETRFKVKRIEATYAEIDVNGESYYIQAYERIFYPQLPYKLLVNLNLFSFKANGNIGYLAKDVTVLNNGTAWDHMYIADYITTYAISNQSVIEVDDYIGHTFVPNQMNVPVTFSTDVALYTYENQWIGTIYAGQTVPLAGVAGEYGYTSFGGASVKFHLSTMYHTNLIDGNSLITHKLMEQKLQTIHAMYPTFTKLQVIGYTVEGRAIYALRVGNGPREVVFDASMHAREYLTTNVLMEMIDEYTHAYAKNSTFEFYNVRQILDTTSIWFIPMVNADGVSLVQNGIYSTPYASTILQLNGSTNVNRWKANIRGVDLNRNFDNNWVASATEPGPNWWNFKGYAPFTEPESQAIRSFFAQHQFQAYISYHSSGNILYYWNWQDEQTRIRDYALALKIYNRTGYVIQSPMYKQGTGTSADWFIRTYKKPGMTVEISPYVGNQPVPLSSFPSIWSKNKTIGLLVAQESVSY